MTFHTYLANVDASGKSMLAALFNRKSREKNSKKARGNPKPNPHLIATNRHGRILFGMTILVFNAIFWIIAVTGYIQNPESFIEKERDEQCEI